MEEEESTEEKGGSVEEEARCVLIVAQTEVKLMVLIGQPRRSESKASRVSESTTPKPDSTSTVRNRPKRSLNSSPNVRKRKKVVSAEYVDESSEEHSVISSPRKRQKLNGSTGSGATKPKRLYGRKSSPSHDRNQSHRHLQAVEDEEEDEIEER